MAVLNTLTVELLGGVNAMVGFVFRKCGEKSKTSEHNLIFVNKTAGRGSLKQGSGRLISVLPRTSESTCRKYAANSGTFEHAAFLTKETAGRSVVAFRYAQHSGILPHTSDFFSIPFGYLPIKPCLPLGLR